jgi:hypothetical protein
MTGETRDYGEKAEQHFTSAGQYLVKAQEACDAGGFDAFRKRFCPKLKRTRAYELLSIASGKKTVEDIRSAKRESMRRSRAAKAAAKSTTVVDSGAETVRLSGQEVDIEKLGPAAQAQLRKAMTVALPDVEQDADRPAFRHEIIKAITDAIDTVAGQEDLFSIVPALASVLATAITFTEPDLPDLQHRLRFLHEMMKLMEAGIRADADVGISEADLSLSDLLYRACGVRFSALFDPTIAPASAPDWWPPGQWQWVTDEEAETKQLAPDDGALRKEPA